MSGWIRDRLRLVVPAASATGCAGTGTDGAPGRTSPARFLALAALLGLLLFLRKPSVFLAPQFWAEEGTVFYREAYHDGFPATLFRPAIGYLHTFVRLVAGASLLLPMERAPLVFAVAAFLAQLAPPLLILRPRSAALIPDSKARLAAALLYVCLPSSFEAHVNVTNSQWHIAVGALCIILGAPAVAGWARALEGAYVAVFAVTGPFSVLFAPISAGRLLAVARGRAGRQGIAVHLLVVAGAVIQATLVLSSGRMSSSVPPSSPLTPGEVATIVSLQTLFSALCGTRGLLAIWRSVPFGVYAAGLVALGALLAVVVVHRVRPLMVLAYLSGASIALSLAFPLNDLRLWLTPSASRYYLFGVLFVLLSLLHIASRRSPWRHAGAVPLLVALCWGIPSDFRVPREPDTHWTDQVAVFRTLPEGTDFYFPVSPTFHGGMTLRKKGVQAPPDSVLSGLAARGQPALTLFAVEAAPLAGNSAHAREGYLNVAGWAADPLTRGPAGGVFVSVDGRLFPATYGIEEPFPIPGVSCRGCAFLRQIPLPSLEPGPHRATLLVVAADGKGYHRTAESHAFVLDGGAPVAR